MQTSGRILILYYEVMGYVLAGLDAFAKQYPEIEVHVFELDHKKITAFGFTANNFFYYKKSSFPEYADFRAKCISIDPGVLIVSGRSDGHYLSLAREFKKSIYTVTIQDTQLKRTWRIKAQSILSYFLYRQYFKGYWGCGKYGTAFGYALGFEKPHIYNYAYSADTALFSSHRITAVVPDPKRTLLFVGQLIERKNINALVSAFITCNDENADKWKLIIVGDGPLKNEIPVRTDIELHGFADAATLATIAQRAGIFCLPSRDEPWGVVVHEFACMGLALLISENCGSAYEFLINGYNGYMFNPNKNGDLQEKMQKMMLLSIAKISEFGNNSALLAARVTPAVWANTLFSIYTNGKELFPKTK